MLVLMNDVILDLNDQTVKLSQQLQLIRSNYQYQLMIKRNLNSSLLTNNKQSQSHSVHKVQPKIQQIRHNRRYSISGNSIRKPSISKQYGGVIQNYESNRRCNYDSVKKQNDQSKGKCSNYNYTTKPIYQARQFNEWESNNNNLSHLSSVRRQSSYGVSQLRNRNRTYLPNQNQNQTLLLNVNYSKYTDGLPLRKQYNYDKKQLCNQNQISYQNRNSIAVKQFQNLSFQNANYSKDNISSTKLKYDYQKFDKKYNYSRVSNTNQNKQRDSSLYQNQNQFFSQIQLASYKNIKPLFEQNNQNNHDYNQLQDKYLLQKQKNQQNYSKGHFKLFELEKTAQKKDRASQKMNRQSQKLNRQIQSINESQRVNESERQKYQKYKEFNSKKPQKTFNLNQYQNNYETNHNASFRKINEQQKQQKAIDSLKQRLQQAILQKPIKSTFDLNNQKNITVPLLSQTNKIIGKVAPISSATNEKTIQKLKMNQFVKQNLKSCEALDPANSSLLYKQSSLLNNSFSNRNQNNQQNQDMKNKQNKLQNKLKAQNEINKFQNSRLSLPNQERCLKLLDFNIPTIVNQNRKNIDLKQKQQKQLLSEWNSQRSQSLKKAQSQTDNSKLCQANNNKISTQNKLKMIGQFNDKINQRIKHIIQNFQGYQMKI